MTRSKKITLLERGMRAEAEGEWDEFIASLSPKARRKYARQYDRAFMRAAELLIEVFPEQVKRVVAAFEEAGRRMGEMKNAFDNYNYDKHREESHENKTAP